MIILSYLLLITVLWYISLIQSFYNDRKNKKLSFPNKKSAFLLLTTFPAFSIYIHLKGAYHSYKEKNYDMMKFFLKLGTYQSSIGISLITEFITRINISKEVYGMEMNGLKIQKGNIKNKQVKNKMVIGRAFFDKETLVNYEKYIPST